MGVCVSLMATAAALATAGGTTAAKGPDRSPTPPDSRIAAMVEAAMDRAADPCDDFYRHACGGWLASSKGEIPEDDAMASRVYQGGEMGRANGRILRDIVEAELRPPILREYYDSCMMATDADDVTVPASVRGAVRDWAESIGGIRTASELGAVVAELHQVGVKALWYLSVGNDLMEPRTNLLQLVQSGLGLPGPAYYEAGTDLLRDYTDHVSRILALLDGVIEGEGAAAAAPSRQTQTLSLPSPPPASATRLAEQVVALETSLASITAPDASTGDFLKSKSAYHRADSAAALAKAYPNVPFRPYLEAMGFSDDASLPVNVVHPHFFLGLPELIFGDDGGDGDGDGSGVGVGGTFSGERGLLRKEKEEEVAPAVRSYLLWQLGHHLSPFLPSAFGDETFRFYGTNLRGQKKRRPRWEVCLAQMDTVGLGQLLGRHFVQRAFSQRSEAAAADMLERIRSAFLDNLPSVGWLDDETRSVAADKATEAVAQMGRPAAWDDFDDLRGVLSEADLLGNAAASIARSVLRIVTSAGAPVDPSRWDLVTGTPQLVPDLAYARVSGISADAVTNPQTVTAFNAESPNYLLVPAGMLRPPVWSDEYPPAMLYGGAGAIVGHEFTHGFDNVGRHFGPDGALSDWWSEEAAAAFDGRAGCMARQYSAFRPLPGLPRIDGNFTLQENIADNGGLKLAWAAYRAEAGGGEAGGKNESIVRGVTNDQLFFLQYGQMWCFNMTRAYTAYWLDNNPHSTPRYRVMGALQNSRHFADAYNCPRGSKYNPLRKCQLW